MVSGRDYAVLVRRPGAVLGALAVLAAASFVVGCGGEAGHASLGVYLSAPLRGPAAEDGRDVAAGARMALGDAGAKAGGVAVALHVLDDADRGGATAVRVAANARTATEDSAAIAYIGELDSATTRTSLPITNEADLLQVSAGASAVDLTRAAPGSDQVPDGTQPSGTRTFGRVVPSDTAQGAAAAAAMARRGIDRVRSIGGGAYGAALRDGFESVTGGPALAGGGPAGGVYVVAPRPVYVTVAGGPVYGADAQIAGAPPSTTLPPRALLVSGALAPSQLPDSDFVAAFRGRYGREPGRFAAYGYEAMAIVLDSIDRADDPLDRQSVIDAFFATRDRDSILGAYSIDEVGDTTLDRVGAYVARRSGPLEPAARPLEVP